MVERSSVSLFEAASDFLSTQEQDGRRRELEKQFLGRALKLLWDFGPVKYKSYGNYKYRYIEPGARSTPQVALETQDGRITMYVEGYFRKDTTPHAHRNAVKPQRLTLRLRSGDKSDGFTITLDRRGRPNPDLQPSSANLQRGLDLLQRIEDGYEEQGLKVNPDASSTDHP